MRRGLPETRDPGAGEGNIAEGERPPRGIGAAEPTLPQKTMPKFRQRKNHGSTASTMLSWDRRPRFCLPDTEGAKVALSDFDGNRVLLVMFICNHCPM